MLLKTIIKIPTIRNGSRYYFVSIGFTLVKQLKWYEKVFQEAMNYNFEIFHRNQIL